MSISDRYEGMELLQSTPTGEIYRARHRTLGRPVLIRTLDTTLLEPAELEQIREAVVKTAKLVHPNILSVIDAEFGAEPYYVTDNVVESLKARLGDSRVDVATGARWGLQLLRGIDHAHGHGVVHRGLSPWRIHFDQVGSVMIADFGLTTVMQDKRTGTTAIEADAAPYLPVGVLRDPSSYSDRADRYGVAAMVVQVLTGAVPEGTAVDVRQASGPIPDDVCAALGKLLGGNASRADLQAAIDAFKRWVDAVGPVPAGTQTNAHRLGNGAPSGAPAAVNAPKAAADKAAADKAAADKAAADKAAADKAAADKAAADKAAADKAAADKAAADKATADKAAADKAAADVGAPESESGRPRRTGSRRAVASGAQPAVPATSSAPPSEDGDRVKGKLNKYASLFQD
ncbi:MAG: protein kinase [Dehalococcoidia bacterium]|nr:protein kinase [Dehalococcoidia bacterium]MCB9506578.1 protein kinase [Myxococcales bacterium]